MDNLTGLTLIDEESKTISDESYSMLYTFLNNEINLTKGNDKTIIQNSFGLSNTTNEYHFFNICCLLTKAFYATSDVTDGSNFTKYFSNAIIHYTNFSRSQWASPTLEMITKLLQPDENTSFWNTIKSLKLTGSVLGGIFECQIHYRLLSEPNLLYKSLNNFISCSRNKIGFEVLKENLNFGSKLQLYYIQSFSDIENLLPKSEYGLLVNENFDAIVSII